MSKHKIEILTTELEELPVVRAWTGLGQPAPRRVEILRWKQKSVIYRLAGVGSGGSDVIGKSCHQHVAALEHRIYADVLPQMGMESLGYYGFADGRSDAERDLAGICRTMPRSLVHVDFAERNVRVRGTVPISGSSFLIGRSQAGVWCRWILPTINALLVARARHLVLDGSRNPAAPDNPVQAAPRRSCGHKLDCRKPGDGACRQAYPPLDCLLRAHD